MENKLRELGEQILKQAEHDQLKTEIAMISLESIHQLLVNNSSNADESEENNIPQFPQYHINTNIFQDAQHTAQTFLGGFDEPQTFGASSNNELRSQLSSIPFLFHNQ